MTRQDFVAVSKIIKKHFPNLSTDKIHEIVSEIADHLDAAVLE